MSALTEFAAAPTSEILPCSMAELQASDTVPTSVSLPAKTMLSFVKYLRTDIENSCNHPPELIKLLAAKMSERQDHQYSGIYSKAEQTEDVNRSLQLLKAIQRGSNASRSNASVAHADADMAEMQAENDLPGPFRQAIHCLHSLLLTLKLADAIGLSCQAKAPVLWILATSLKNDLARALRALAVYTGEGTQTQLPRSVSPVEVMTTAEAAVLSMSTMCTGLLMPCLKSAIKLVNTQYNCHKASMCSMQIMESFL